MAELEVLAGTFRGLAHPTRLMILTALRDGERLSPKEITRRIDGDATLPLVSHHMRELTRLRLLRPAGTRPTRGCIEHFYRLSAYGRSVLRVVDSVDVAREEGAREDANL
jgi:DNA-binding transcriptional ArsR family regulator